MEQDPQLRRLTTDQQRRPAGDSLVRDHPAGNVFSFENGDYLVMQIQNLRGGGKAFDYEPHLLAMKRPTPKAFLHQGGEMSGSKGPRQRLTGWVNPNYCAPAIQRSPGRFYRPALRAACGTTRGRTIL